MCWLMILFALLSTGNCIRWHMQPNSQKCLREELRKDILVKGVYEVVPINGLQVDYTVSALKQSHDFPLANIYVALIA